MQKILEHHYDVQFQLHLEFFKILWRPLLQGWWHHFHVYRKIAERSASRIPGLWHWSFPPSLKNFFISAENSSSRNFRCLFRSLVTASNIGPSKYGTKSLCRITPGNCWTGQIFDCGLLSSVLILVPSSWDWVLLEDRCFVQNPHIPDRGLNKVAGRFCLAEGSFVPNRC